VDNKEDERSECLIMNGEESVDELLIIILDLFRVNKEDCRVYLVIDTINTK
jgi:hypothetical protein